MTWLEDGTTITLGLWSVGGVVGKPLSTVDPYQVECLTRVEASNFLDRGWEGREAALFASVQHRQKSCW